MWAAPKVFRGLGAKGQRTWDERKRLRHSGIVDRLGRKRVMVLAESKKYRRSGFGEWGKRLGFGVRG